jgi:hypothetical protein
MKILYICINDWANYGYNQCEALKSIGLDASCCKLNPHIFKYDQQAEIVAPQDMMKMVLQADYINFIHGEIRLVNQMEYLLREKKVAVTYTGSAYRNAPLEHNSTFDGLVDYSFTDQCEFMGLGAKNLHYIAAAVPVSEIDKFGHEIRKPLRVGHYPSNAEVKGTNQILAMLEELHEPFQLLHSTDNVSHRLQFKRMNACDIYVELFKPYLGGKPYGHFGVTAFEAAAAGKIVVTQNLHQQFYREAYGDCPLVLVKDRIGFINAMDELLGSSEQKISQLQTETYSWVSEKHSYEATARRILSIIQ